jgi:hypothetical protein
MFHAHIHPMSIPDKELKQQREQIQKHLEWLDAKIAEQEATSENDAPTEAEVLAEVPTPPLPEGAQLSQPPVDKATATTETDQLSAKVALAPDSVSSYRPKTQSDVLRAKIGCFAFFILGTALFLFLLFGLPYLL